MGSMKKIRNGGGAPLLDRCSKGFESIVKCRNYFRDYSGAGGESVVEKIIPALSIKVNKAFTLAEVLITLGIIGVVAAMTIPTLISNYKAKVYGTRLKEFYSIMSQAVMLSEIENGPKSTWKKHSLDENYDEDGNLDYSASYSYNYEFFVTYIAPFIKYTSETIRDNSIFYLTNGTKIYMWNGSCVDMIVDVNGDDSPNKRGYDSFDFQLCLNAKYNIGPGSSCDNYTREECIQKCKENTNYCTSLLKMDNWQFKDDYPYKI